MYLIHRQSGYFQSIAKMVEQVLDQPCKYSTDASERGTWVLFFTSYKSEFYKNIKDPYILVNTEQSHVIFKDHPKYKKMYDNAIRVLDFSDNLQIGYCDSFRLECEESKDIDVLFYGVLTSRRKRIIDSLNISNKVIFTDVASSKKYDNTLPPIHSSELWKYINRSKIVLNVASKEVLSAKYENNNAADWVRLAPLLSNRSFVITESCNNPDFMSLKDSLVIVDYDKIISTVDYYLKNPLKRIEMADRGFDYIRKNRPTKIL